MKRHSFITLFLLFTICTQTIQVTAQPQNSYPTRIISIAWSPDGKSIVGSGTNGLLRVWDTEENAGVLIYLLLADRDVEIVADRGIDRAVDAGTWQRICTEMESRFARGHYGEAVIAGIESTSRVLAQHFPRHGAAANEIPDKPVVL